MNKHRGTKVAESSGYGVKSRATPESMDCAQPLSSDPKVFEKFAKHLEQIYFLRPLTQYILTLRPKTVSTWLVPQPGGQMESSMDFCTFGLVKNNF
jgi:hypothetical protein